MKAGTKATQAALLLGMGLAVYIRALGGDFHYDDFHSLVLNPSVRSLDSLGAFFVDPGRFSADPDKAMYRPLLLVSYAFNYALASGYNAAWFLAVNLAIHLACTLLVWAVGRQMDEPNAIWAAVLFAVHPLASEPVNYISSRSESLAALGVLAALWAHGRQNGRWDLAAWCFFVAALLVKSVAIVLPALLLLRQWLSGGPMPWRRHWPFWLTAGCYVGWLVQVGFLGPSLQGAPRPALLHWLTQLKAGIYYVWLAIMPVAQNVEHPFVAATAGDGAPWVAALLLVSLGAALWWGGRRAFFWGGWVLVCLAPSSLVPLNVLVNEHRLYLAGVGLVYLLSGPLARRPRLGVAVVVCCAVLAWQRTGVWRDELSLWGDAVVKAPAMPRAQAQWGYALREAGRLAEARAAFEAAALLDPGHRAARANLATMAYETALAAGDSVGLERAAAAFAAVLRDDPQYTEALNGLGGAYMALGRATEATAAFVRLAALRPRFAPAHYNLGLLAAGRGAWAEAATHYGRAAELNPDGETLRRWGDALASAGDLAGAAGAYTRAAERGADARLWFNWAEVLLVLGQQRRDAGDEAGAQAHWRQARAHLVRLLQGEPGHQRARARLRQLDAVSPR